MVLFHNINVGQRVEVNIGWGAVRGTVQYKGCLVGKQGDWVGVNLEDKVGNCNGMVNGRRYFQCSNDHGLFVRANRIRFIPLQRCLYNKYHKVRSKSFVDEPLFGTSEIAWSLCTKLHSQPLKPEVDNGLYDPIKVSASYHHKISVGESLDDDDIFRRKYHPLKHLISNTMPAATMKRPRSVTLSYYSDPIHAEYEPDYSFISSPSIPKTHMPFSALKRQVKRGWENSHYVREMSVPTGRDSMKLSQWNDISP